MLERFASQVAMASGRVALLTSILAAALLMAGRGRIRSARRRPIRLASFASSCRSPREARPTFCRASSPIG